MWGNSLALRIPAVLAKDLFITPGTKADLSIKDGRIIIKPIIIDYSFDALMAGVTEENINQGINTSPIGKEDI
jgi:antitoxin MazE